MEVHVSLVGRNNLTREIYRQLREAILDGRLTPGERLPPSRELARRLAVSRTTVMLAYDQLIGEEFLTARRGDGTYVSEHVFEHATPTTADGKPDRHALSPRPIWASIVPPDEHKPPADFDFRTGVSDVSLFPHATWRRLVARQIRASAPGIGIYGDPAGHPRLREAIVRHIGTSRAVQAVADDVIVTNGSQQALDLIARALLAPGEEIAVEDPSYRPPRQLFTSLGLTVRGVPVDEEGIEVDAIPAGCRCVYVTPSHQYPLGMAMSLSRRLALLRWARQHDAAIVEDDYDSEFRFEGRPIEPLQTLDSDGRVLYVGSFSKAMLPSLRLGFVVSPPPLRAAIEAAKYVTDWHTSHPLQGALAEFLDQGLFARHVRKMRSLYQERHELVVDMARRILSDHLKIIGSMVGLHVSGYARDPSNDRLQRIVDKALSTGVAVQKFSTFSTPEPTRPGLMLGYGAIEAEKIPEGLSRLRQCFHDD